MIFAFFLLLGFNVGAEPPPLSPDVLEYTAQTLADGECPTRGSPSLTKSIPDAEEFLGTYQNLFYVSSAPLVKRVGELKADLHAISDEDAKKLYPKEVKRVAFRQGKFFVLTTKRKRQLIGFAAGSSGFACTDLPPEDSSSGTPS